MIETKPVNVSVPKTSVSPSFVQDIEGNILKNKMEAVPPSLLNQLKQQNIIVSNFGTNSNYLMVNFVNVRDFRSSLIDDVLKLGHYLGPSIKVGPEMTTKILTENGQVLHRST